MVLLKTHDDINFISTTHTTIINQVALFNSTAFHTTETDNSTILVDTTKVTSDGLQTTESNFTQLTSSENVTVKSTTQATRFVSQSKTTHHITRSPSLPSKYTYKTTPATLPSSSVTHGGSNNDNNTTKVELHKNESIHEEFFDEQHVGRYKKCGILKYVR